eukprot:TRINITY_DN26186_c0_g1_i2.p1 TRINITY_DN26186_c0_g1~~TRINITY_DN26186_c0_g1_i2.p1  ORF type:complete len:168 (+),score=61.85 TRINITY_DN26186_c0_g1_i2:58-504(+)
MFASVTRTSQHRGLAAVMNMQKAGYATLKFTESHEWLQLDGKTGRVGISQYAAKEIGDVVYVEEIEADTEVEAGDVVTTIESVKATGDIYSPVAGVVTRGNEALEDTPSLVDQDPMGEGWLFEIDVSDESGLDKMMSQEEYDAFIKDL